MTEAEILLGVAQGLFTLILGVGGWLLRRALDEVRTLERGLGEVRERLVRTEERVDGVSRLEGKIDDLAGDVREVRERVAALGAPRQRE